QYWIPGMTYNFYGVYPAGYGSCTNSGVITVEGFDCSEAVDLMTATATGLLGDDAPTVAMEFRHELARVKVSVESNGATVDGLKVYGVGYKGNFSSGVPSKWTVTGTAEENTTPLSGETELDMLLLPTTDLTNAKLKVTYHYGNDASATRTDDASLAIAEGWTAGQQYHYKVSIVAGKLTIIVTVVDWNEEDTSVSWG
ncbi:MAG: fimbrillin family protein, partial [Bacteroides sp.]|nr:fimbrillin family protein [Bacteroides sp.]